MFSLPKSKWVKGKEHHPKGKNTITTTRAINGPGSEKAETERKGPNTADAKTVESLSFSLPRDAVPTPTSRLCLPYLLPPFWVGLRSVLPVVGFVCCLSLFQFGW